MINRFEDPRWWLFPCPRCFLMPWTGPGQGDSKSGTCRCRIENPMEAERMIKDVNDRHRAGVRLAAARDAARRSFPAPRRYAA